MNQKNTTIYTLLALLIATTSLASPAAADHLPDPSYLEMEALEPCDASPIVCAALEQLVMQAPGGCNIKVYWTCVDAGIDALNNVLDRVKMLDEVDYDEDFIPDAMESEMCGRAVIRDNLDEVPYGGACVTPSDYDEGVNGLYFFVPGGYSFGPDFDGDDIPSTIILDGHYVIMTFDRANTFYTYEASVYQILDDNDYDRNVPVPNDDVDGAVAFAGATAAYIVSEAESWAAHAVNLASMVGALLFAIAEQTAADAVETADTEAGNAWAVAMNTWEPIYNDVEQTVEDTYGFAWSTFWNTYGYVMFMVGQTLDSVDADGDLIIDDAEPFICYVENSNSDLDGYCIGSNYYRPV